MEIQRDHEVDETGPWIREGLLVVVSAPSGAGKTTLCKEVVKYIPDIQHSVSYTTRSARPSEVDGSDYHFVSVETFKNMIDEDAFIEWAIVHGNYYGTSRKELTVLLNSGIDSILLQECNRSFPSTRIWKTSDISDLSNPSITELR